MKKVAKIAVVVALLIAVGILIAVKSRGPRSAVNSSAQPGPAKSADDLGQAELPRLVDLGADKCIPCTMMAPILEKLREEYAGRLQVEFYDVRKDPGIGDLFGIRLIPTQIFFDPAGNELWRHEGFLSREDILAKWKELGIDLSAGTSAQPENQGNDHESE